MLKLVTTYKLYNKTFEMENSKEFELISEISFALKDCPLKDNVICVCSRVWCNDYHKYIEGTKGKKIFFIWNFIDILINDYIVICKMETHLSYI